MCYDNFYMEKLNCSFPWIKRHNATLQKCGPKHKIQDLIDIIDQGDDEEVSDLNNCNISNCQTITWRYYLQDTLFPNNDKGFISFLFPSHAKASKIKIFT